MMVVSYESLDKRHYKVIDSTNTEARRLLTDGLIVRPTLITADMQTGGRGRQGKSFYSPEGSGIYMTLVLFPDCPMDAAVTLTTRVACATAAAIAEVSGVTPGIKWVNDLYLKGRKICGILCEAVNDYSTSTLKTVIIGIGVNISTEDFPEELKAVAGSLSLAAPEGLKDIGSFKQRLAESIARHVLCLDSCGFPEYYREHSIVLGRDIRYIEDGVSHEAHAVDIDDLGGLVIEEHGQRRTLTSGEISIKM